MGNENLSKQTARKSILTIMRRESVNPFQKMVTLPPELKENSLANLVVVNLTSILLAKQATNLNPRDKVVVLVTGEKIRKPLRVQLVVLDGVRSLLLQQPILRLLKLLDGEMKERLNLLLLHQAGESRVNLPLKRKPNQRKKSLRKKTEMTNLEPLIGMMKDLVK